MQTLLNTDTVNVWNYDKKISILSLASYGGIVQYSKEIIPSWQK